MHKNIYSIIQIMFYYLIEALLIGVIFYVCWLTIMPKFNVNVKLTYIDCTAIVWLFKLLRFNIFQFINDYQYIDEANNDNKQILND